MLFSVLPNFIRKTKVASSFSTNSLSIETPPASSPRKLQESAAARQVGIFPPNETKTDLIIEENLFSRIGDSYHIKKQEGKLYRNLQVREKLSRAACDEMIFEDASTGEPKIVIVKYITSSGYRFNIYVTHPICDRQDPINRMNVTHRDRLYSFARVEQSSSTTRSLQVFVADDESSSPTYIIQQSKTMSYSAKNVIKYQGKTVASTCMYDENSHLLKVQAGTDACFMLCLLCIADEFVKQEWCETQRLLDDCF